ncbi:MULTISPECIES: GNAT family N-acetyltransferase [unclassified Rossellomorea]|uniref:GNAT family N-acetyltransferase n=1 Tax=unclassified Rossellomorea TaxID=2837526 RepID=UPI002609F4ED|nr:GNAT family N-acetyltransferase [uncultured Rossellomorea sp.]
MPTIEIRRPGIEDQEELNQFFSTVIKHTFYSEGISEMVDDIENEIASKKRYLKSDLESNGKDRYFLIASEKGGTDIMGTIEYGPASELIRTCTDGALNEIYEVGTVFVHPDYQGRGVGTLLLNVMFLTFLNRGIQEFCLDSGYALAQKIWKGKFGEPDYWLKDYWGIGSDHMIWKKSMNDVSINFKW